MGTLESEMHGRGGGYHVLVGRQRVQLRHQAGGERHHWRGDRSDLRASHNARLGHHLTGNVRTCVLHQGALFIGTRQLHSHRIRSLPTWPVGGGPARCEWRRGDRHIQLRGHQQRPTPVLVRWILRRVIVRPGRPPPYNPGQPAIHDTIRRWGPVRDTGSRSQGILHRRSSREPGGKADELPGDRGIPPDPPQRHRLRPGFPHRHETHLLRLQRGRGLPHQARHLRIDRGPGRALLDPGSLAAAGLRLQVEVVHRDVDLCNL